MSNESNEPIEMSHFLVEFIPHADRTKEPTQQFCVEAATSPEAVGKVQDLLPAGHEIRIRPLNFVPANVPPNNTVWLVEIGVYGEVDAGTYDLVRTQLHNVMNALSDDPEVVDPYIQMSTISPVAKTAAT